jgi:hypothetical protein
VEEKKIHSALHPRKQKDNKKKEERYPEPEIKGNP